MQNKIPIEHVPGLASWKLCFETRPERLSTLIWTVSREMCKETHSVKKKTQLCPLNSKDTAYKACTIITLQNRGNSFAKYHESLSHSGVLGTRRLFHLLHPGRGLSLTAREAVFAPKCLLLEPLPPQHHHPLPLGNSSHSMRNRVLESMK